MRYHESCAVYLEVSHRLPCTAGIIAPPRARPKVCNYRLPFPCSVGRAQEHSRDDLEP